MAKSKTDKSRKKKVEQFKETAQVKAAQQQIPRTHLVPIPTWQSTENLDLRGDLLEAFEQQLVIAMDAIQKCGQALQYAMQQNIKSEKIKLEYQWNNGEKPTEKEVEDFLAEQKKLQEARKQQMLDMQAEIQRQANHAKTGLVGPDGSPVATDQNLSEDEDQQAEDEVDDNDSDK